MNWFQRLTLGLGGAPPAPITVWVDASLIGLLDLGCADEHDLSIVPRPADRVGLVKRLMAMRHVTLVVELEETDVALGRVVTRSPAVTRVTWRVGEAGRLHAVTRRGRTSEWASVLAASRGTSV